MFFPMLQVADGARATLGLDIAACVVTSQPVGVTVKLSASGASWGSLGDSGEKTLLEAARKLIDMGCTAIAVVCRFPEDDEAAAQGLDTASLFKAYQQGVGVDAIAGAEALISRVITKEFLIPCAHAPAFDQWEIDANVSPKCCAEELGYTFLPCILSYLHRAPDLVVNSSLAIESSNIVRSRDVDSVVVPIDCLGGPAVLALLAQGAMVVAVEENRTSMQASSSELAISKTIGLDKYKVVEVRSYAEAAGVIAAHREGILLESITKYVEPIVVIEL